MKDELPAALRLAFDREEAAAAPRDVPLAEVYADIRFPSGTAERPFVALNLVQTLDGAAAIDGRARGIGTPVDHYLYRTLHGLVDAVLFGAGTLRAENVVVGTHPHLRARREAAGLPPAPRVVVVTATAAFDESLGARRVFAGSDPPPLIMTTPRAAAAALERLRVWGAEIVMVEVDAAGRVDVTAGLRQLAARGLHRIMAEGGPALATSFLRAGLVAELFLTVALRVAGDPGAPRFPDAPVAAVLSPLSIFHYLDRGGALREVYLRAAVTSGPRRDFR